MTYTREKIVEFNSRAVRNDFRVGDIVIRRDGTSGHRHRIIVEINDAGSYRYYLLINNYDGFGWRPREHSVEQTKDLYGKFIIVGRAGIIDGGVRIRDEYAFRLFVIEGVTWLIAGCRRFRSLKEAKRHWTVTQKHRTLKSLNAWSIKRATKLFAEAKKRGWL